MDGLMVFIALLLVNGISLLIMSLQNYYLGFPIVTMLIIMLVDKYLCLTLPFAFDFLKSWYLETYENIYLQVLST